MDGLVRYIVQSSKAPVEQTGSASSSSYRHSITDVR